MLHARPTTYLTSAVILICMVYWLTRASYPKTPYMFSGSSILHQDEAGTLSYAPPSYDSLPPSPFDDPPAPVSLEEENVSQEQQVATELFQPPSAKSKFPARFPRQIWQTSSIAALEKYADKIETWKNIRGFDYHWLSDDDATSFVHEKFSNRPSIINFWDSLSSSHQIVLRADFLRYLLMLSEGGVYSDIDTSVLKHPDVWIPVDLGALEINAIIGIEYDDNTYPMFVRPISFCQWTLMSKPNHPIFEAAVDRVLSNLEFLARRQRVNITDLKLEKMDVIEGTGPGMITDVVMQVIRDSSKGEAITWSTFHNQMAATLYGDVLILPINGFAGAQKHSHAGSPEYGDMFVQHHFGRSWYAPSKAGGPLDKSKENEKVKSAESSTTTTTVPRAVPSSSVKAAAEGPGLSASTTEEMSEMAKLAEELKD